MRKTHGSAAAACAVPESAVMWSTLRDEFVSGSFSSLRALASARRVSYAAVRRRARVDGWAAARACARDAIRFREGDDLRCAVAAALAAGRAFEHHASARRRSSAALASAARRAHLAYGEAWERCLRVIERRRPPARRKSP
jgi:hypothetical protein